MKLIAEIGLNHCGSINRASNLLKALFQTSVDAITFQIREKSFYDGTHPRKVELSEEFYNESIKLTHANNQKIGF